MKWSKQHIKKRIKHLLFLAKYYKWKTSDPTKFCPLYTELGCSFIDGFLCDYPFCSMMRKYKEKKIKNN